VQNAWAGVLETKDEGVETETASIPTALGFDAVPSLEMTTPPPSQDEHDLGVSAHHAPKLAEVLEVAIASQDASDSLPSTRSVSLKDAPSTPRKEVPGADPALAAADAVKALTMIHGETKPQAKAGIQLEIEAIKAQVKSLRSKKSAHHVMRGSGQRQAKAHVRKKGILNFSRSKMGHEHNPLKMDAHDALTLEENTPAKKPDRSANAVVPETVADSVTLATGTRSGVSGVSSSCNSLLSTLIALGTLMAVHLHSH